MSVDCVAVFPRKTPKPNQNLMLKARNEPLKKYDVTLTAHYQKTVSVYAESPEQAKEKTKIILFNTDLINFTDDDLSAAKPILPSRARTVLTVRTRTHYGRMKIVRTVRTSAPCAVSVCMRTTAKNEMSYQALNLVSQIRLLGVSP